MKRMLYAYQTLALVCGLILLVSVLPSVNTEGESTGTPDPGTHTVFLASLHSQIDDDDISVAYASLEDAITASDINNPEIIELSADSSSPEGRIAFKVDWSYEVSDYGYDEDYDIYYKIIIWKSCPDVDQGGDIIWSLVGNYQKKKEPDAGVLPPPETGSGYKWSNSIAPDYPGQMLKVRAEVEHYKDNGHEDNHRQAWVYAYFRLQIPILTHETGYPASVAATGYYDGEGVPQKDTQRAPSNNGEPEEQHWKHIVSGDHERSFDWSASGQIDATQTKYEYWLQGWNLKQPDPLLNGDGEEANRPSRSASSFSNVFLNDYRTYYVEEDEGEVVGVIKYFFPGANQFHSYTHVEQVVADTDKVMLYRFSFRVLMFERFGGQGEYNEVAKNHPEEIEEHYGIHIPLEDGRYLNSDDPWPCDTERGPPPSS